ncbi:MAG: 3-hydroxyacyl-ACP dehydratase FabZ [Planctomycetota bacterium]|nr:MAG: 3-hydroxyacyl-ACP dehydratase FabZ [Planctomycetota bacterium]
MILDFEGVRRLLPQGPPFLFIDRVLELEKGRSIVCKKNVSGAEPYFPGHFPELAVMPGALIGEAIAQAAILLFRLSEEENRAAGGRVFVIGTTRTRFLQPVFPGDTLFITVQVDKLFSASAMVSGRAEVDGRVVTRSTLTMSVLPPGALQKKPPEP